jgi:uncharacterized protein (TIGR00369 family)
MSNNALDIPSYRQTTAENSLNLIQEIGLHLSGLEQLRIMMENDRRPGMAKTMDIKLTTVNPGHVVFEAMPDARMYNPVGTVHGGFAATILDFACGYPVLAMMQPGQGFSTLDLHVSYHRKITQNTGLVRAEGKLINIGRRAAFTKAELTDKQGKLLASATSSLLVMCAE